MYHENNTKKLEDVLVNKKREYFYDSELKVLHKPSADVQLKILKYTFNPMNIFLL